MGIFLEGESLYHYHRRINPEHLQGEMNRYGAYHGTFVDKRGQAWRDHIVHTDEGNCRCVFGGQFSGYEEHANFYHDYILAARGRLEVAA